MRDETTRPADLSEAVRNMLFACGGFAPGDRLTICREDASHGWYDAQVAEAVAREAEKLGLLVTLADALPPEEPQPAALARAIASDDSIVYFARVGDQDRFGASGAAGRRVMVYARNAPDLASAFGRVPHAAMRALKLEIDQVLFGADCVEITCAAGTLMAGRVAELPEVIADTTIRRFPLGVPAPVPAQGFCGQVALTGALTPTGNTAYDPPVMPLTGRVLAHVDRGRIIGFEGAQADVAAIESHYARISLKLGIDPWVVHSWHAGIHPGCRFFGPEGADLDYWSNTVFSSPRLLHFHTCGAQAPGEISWNIIDPTVHVDGVPLWNAGVLEPRAFPSLAACLGAHPELDALFGGAVRG